MQNVGAFAHSFGIEAAQQLGVLTELPLEQYIHSLLSNLSSQDLPFIRTANTLVTTLQAEGVENPDVVVDAWCSLDAEYSAIVVNDVARRASILQGTALVRVTQAGLCSSESMQKVLTKIKEISTKNRRVNGLLAPCFGFVCALLGKETIRYWSNEICVDSCNRSYVILKAWLVSIIDGIGLSKHDAEEMYLYAASRDIISACIRLSLCGPIEAVGMQRNLTAYCAQLLGNKEGCLERSEFPYQTFPLGDIVQGCHAQLFRKMFNT